MTLGKFTEEFIEHNSLIRLVYKADGGHQTVLDNWNDVGMAWAVNKATGGNRHYINNEVLGIASIYTRGHYPEAINIVIEKLENQPLVDEVVNNQQHYSESTQS